MSEIRVPFPSDMHADEVDELVDAIRQAVSALCRNDLVVHLNLSDN